MHTKLFAALILSMVYWNSMGQNLHFYGVLPAINHTGKITKQLNYNVFLSSTFDAFNETIDKVYYPASDLQLYIQPSLVLSVKPNHQYAFSYTFQRNNPVSWNHINEHRLWIQSQYFYPIRNAKLSNRFRYEQRFIQDRISLKFNPSSRFRYQLALNKPLKGPTLETNEWYLNTYNEAYFSLQGAKNALYSENWTYLGIGYSLGKWGKFEMGYLNQIFVRDLKHDLRVLNLLQCTWLTHF